MVPSRLIEVRPTDLKLIFPLRHAILRTGLPRESAQYDRDNDVDAVHFAAFAGERLVGCVTMYPEPIDGEAAWRVRGMAVADNTRGLGVGRKLLEAVDQQLRAVPPPFVWCNARLPAVGFYERCGWQAISDVYDIPGVGPHRKMVRRLEIFKSRPTVREV